MSTAALSGQAKAKEQSKAAQKEKETAAAAKKAAGKDKVRPGAVPNA
jgi:hypothetical protein